MRRSRSHPYWSPLMRRLVALEHRLIPRRPDDEVRARINAMTTEERRTRLHELINVAKARDAAARAAGLPDPPVAPATRALHARLEAALAGREAEDDEP